ncbi:MAG: hypothetical protein Q7V62_10335, partial [Actinomycetota bacterium]|nr:hypothetical protein [Actinomycetota bacterium]
TMRRQRKALEYYVHELEAANPAFPFVRRTYATHEPNLAHRFIRSKAGGGNFLGVEMQQHVPPDTTVLAYPGVLMTKEEYDAMPYHIRTAADINTNEWEEKKARLIRPMRGKQSLVLVGWPDEPGVSVMDPKGTPEGANVVFIQDNEECRMVGDKLALSDRCASICTRREDEVDDDESASLEPGAELLLRYTKKGTFFVPEEPHCAFCFAYEEDPDMHLGMCRTPHCRTRWHAECAGYRDHVEGEPLPKPFHCRAHAGQRPAAAAAAAAYPGPAAAAAGPLAVLAAAAAAPPPAAFAANGWIQRLLTFVHAFAIRLRRRAVDSEVDNLFWVDVPHAIPGAPTAAQLLAVVSARTRADTTGRHDLLHVYDAGGGLRLVFTRDARVRPTALQMVEGDRKQETRRAVLPATDAEVDEQAREWQGAAHGRDRKNDDAAAMQE